MPITVTRIEPDDEGGWLIAWHDDANLDGQPLDAFFHLTEEAVDELLRHQRAPNQAPTERLEHLRDRLTVSRGAQGRNRTTATEEIAAAFTSAYDEVLIDIKDRHRFGMKSVTLDGHLDLEAVRGGAPVRPWNRRPDTSPLEAFIARQRDKTAVRSE
jgi:hypothetical protein